MNNKLRTAIITATVASVSLLSVAPALAYSPNDNHPGFFDRIAEMFGFKKGQNKAKPQLTAEQKAQKHEQKLNTKLDGLVAAGKITEAQKAELKIKLDAIEQIRQNSDGKTPQQKHDAVKAAQDDLKAWAESNGLTLAEILPPKKGHKPGYTKGMHQTQPQQ